MQNQFTVAIRLGNAGMMYPDDVAAALEQIAGRLAGTIGAPDGAGWPHGAVRDINGNTVGSYAVVTGVQQSHG